MSNDIGIWHFKRKNSNEEAWTLNVFLLEHLFILFWQVNDKFSCFSYGWYCLRTIWTPTSENYFRTCAPSEDSDQPAHSRSLIRIFTGHILDSQWCQVSSCGQQWLIRLRWLIWVFVGCTYHKVLFLMLRLIWKEVNTDLSFTIYMCFIGILLW